MSDKGEKTVASEHQVLLVEVMIIHMVKGVNACVIVLFRAYVVLRFHALLVFLVGAVIENLGIPVIEPEKTRGNVWNRVSVMSDSNFITSTGLLLEELSEIPIAYTRSTVGY